MSGNPSGNNNGGVGSSGGGSGSPCGACKFLRRKCVAGCVFAPYFDSEQGAAHFAAVHKVFGASNVSKLLQHIPANKRLDAVVTICYEAQARLRDPVYGCVAHIFTLQQQVVNLQAELSYLQAHLAALELPTPPPPPLPPPLLIPSTTLSILDLPTVPPTYDLSSLFDPNPMVTMPSTRQIDHHLPGATRAPPEISSSAGGEDGGGGDLQELARELLFIRGPPSVSCLEASSLPTQSKGNL